MLLRTARRDTQRYSDYPRITIDILCLITDILCRLQKAMCPTLSSRKANQKSALYPARGSPSIRAMRGLVPQCDINLRFPPKVLLLTNPSAGVLSGEGTFG